MPYIKKDRREAVSEGQTMLTAGELNYRITTLLLGTYTPTRFIIAAQAAIDDYMDGKPLEYQTINDVIGAVIGALFEYASRKGTAHPFEGSLFQIIRDYYKTVAAPYEKIKAEQNGDLYV